MATILLVEDNEMNLDMLSRRLEKRGHTVYVARDGMAGIERTQQVMPDIVLMDMSLPVMDGWEAMRRLKASPTTRKIPIIALTAHAIAGDREKCLEAGADDYATKPVLFDELLAQIKRLTGG
ncbi:MAG: response regulator [Anaerolineae bacterium]|nr:response regulator [Anaerolineae bacterium]